MITPESSRPGPQHRNHVRNFTTLRRAGLLSGAFAIALLTQGCVVYKGDLGREAKSTLLDKWLPKVGETVAAGTGKSVSRYAYTPEERELRDRAVRLRKPIRGESGYGTLRRKLQLARLWNKDNDVVHDPSAYHRALNSANYGESQARLAAIQEDIEADISALVGFGEVALRVVAADRQRMDIARRNAGLPGGDPGDAVMRVAENRDFIEGTVTDTHDRLIQYRYAVERARLAAPEAGNRAWVLERRLGDLSYNMSGLEEALLGRRPQQRSAWTEKPPPEAAIDKPLGLMLPRVWNSREQAWADDRPPIKSASDSARIQP